MKTVKCLLICLMVLPFVFGCDNSIGDGVADVSSLNNEGAEVAVSTAEASNVSEKLPVEFTGNIYYDIGTLNAYWEKHPVLPLTGDEASSPRALAKGASTSAWDAILKFAWDKAAIPALSAGASAIGGFVAGKILNALGFATESSNIADILDQMKKVNEQLAVLQKTVDEINEKISKLDLKIEQNAKYESYRSVMQRRKEYYVHMYTNVMTLENSILDIVFAAAVNSKIDSTRTLSWLADKSLEDKIAWINSIYQDPEKVKESDYNAFTKYCIKHSEEIVKKMNDKVLKWGETKGAVAATAAQDVIGLLKLLTDKDAASELGKSVEKNMFELYDAYAAVGFVWESEGYEWRERMRIEDCAIVALIAPYATWYYSLTEETGAASINATNAKKTIKTLQDVVKNYPVKRYSTQKYQKYGSKWAGQIFTGKINQIDYAKVLETMWQYPEPVTTKVLTKNVGLKYKLVHEAYMYNTSRLYGGFKPYGIGGSRVGNPYSKSVTMAMPEEWYKELFDAYVVRTVNGTKHKTLMEIFKDVGFSFASGNFVTGAFRTSEYEQFFITNLRPYAHVYRHGDHIMNVGIPVVTGNTDTDIYRTCGYDNFIFRALSCQAADHEIYAVQFRSRILYHSTKRGLKPSEVNYDDSVFESVINPFKYRTFYYPVRTDKAK